jgi:hypothetical protein
MLNGFFVPDPSAKDPDPSAKDHVFVTETNSETAVFAVKDELAQIGGDNDLPVAPPSVVRVTLRSGHAREQRLAIFFLYS